MTDTEFHMTYLFLVFFNFNFKMSEISNTCINCKNAFDIRSKGYKRYSIFKTLLKGRCIAVYLEEYSIYLYSSQIPQFLCHVCYNLLCKTVAITTAEEDFLKRSISAKRKIADRTPVKVS